MLSQSYLHFNFSIHHYFSPPIPTRYSGPTPRQRPPASHCKADKRLLKSVTKTGIITWPAPSYLIRAISEDYRPPWAHLRSPLCRVPGTGSSAGLREQHRHCCQVKQGTDMRTSHYAVCLHENNVQRLRQLPYTLQDHWRLQAQNMPVVQTAACRRSHP